MGSRCSRRTAVGVWAPRPNGAIADYLFDTTLIERLEASTDVENLAEQRALDQAGFQREGRLRHAQFRDGQWHELLIYSRLRGDRSP